MMVFVLNLLIIICEKFLVVWFFFNVCFRKKFVCFFLFVVWIVVMIGVVCYVRFKEIYEVGDNIYICGEDWLNVIVLKNM